MIFVRLFVCYLVCTCDCLVDYAFVLMFVRLFRVFRLGLDKCLYVLPRFDGLLVVNFELLLVRFELCLVILQLHLDFGLLILCFFGCSLCETCWVFAI